MKTKKRTQNDVVADWLIEYRWQNLLSTSTKMQLPSFVNDAVMAACYIVAGTSNGQLSISPKLVARCLTLREISTDSVKRMEVGYDMSDRHARRLAQVVRFALDGIVRRVQEFEHQLTDEQKENIQMEKSFKASYYRQQESPLYSNVVEVTQEMRDLHKAGKIDEYVALYLEAKYKNS